MKNLSKTLFPYGKGKTRARVHFIGIGGIGVSALARWFLAQKWLVSGSDITRSSITQELIKEGVNVKIGHKSAHLSPLPDLTIHTSAVTRGNPEFRAAHKKKVPVLTYPEAIARLTEGYRAIGIAGSHGKSTTTAMITRILCEAKKDPTVIVGTKLNELNGKNFRAGKSAYLALESDEWAGAFLHYSPFVAVVTNIDREHLDFYKNLARVKIAFLTFLGNVLPGGAIMVNRDDKNLWSLRARIAKIASARKTALIWYTASGTHAKKIRAHLSIPGQHNVSNAVAAYEAARFLGIPERTILAALRGYRGAWRRMEYRGRFTIHDSRFRNKKTQYAEVYDDYGHHPTEIKATLQAFKEKFPTRTLLCVYQPHQAKRLQALFWEFQNAFNAADMTLVMPLYKVPGRDEKIDPRFDSESLVRAIQKHHPKQRIFYLTNPNNLKKALQTLLRVTDRMSPPVTLVMMGAGNIVDYTSSLME